MDLTLGPEVYRFVGTPLSFEEDIYTNVFAGLATKTLGQTIEGRKYRGLSDKVQSDYPEHLGTPIGDFVYELKMQGDIFYRNFLNNYGDESYCRFCITEQAVHVAKGLYLFSAGGEILYLGRCRDSFAQRINRGYGSISPKNCYLDGQSTNCRINSLVADQSSQIRFEVWVSDDELAIEELEVLLINEHKPPWNHQHAD
jgi:hypothetical protein